MKQTFPFDTYMLSPTLVPRLVIIVGYSSHFDKTFYKRESGAFVNKEKCYATLREAFTAADVALEAQRIKIEKMRASLEKCEAAVKKARAKGPPSVSPQGGA